MKLEQLTETVALANKLMDEHGLLEQGWKFKFANDKRTVGWCRHGEKTIEVSKYYLDSHPDEIRDTILHEIAHALVGPNHGHDSTWRRMCIEIGANPTRTTDAAVFNGNFNYTVSCQNDDCPHPWTAGRHRIKEAYWGYHCKFCKGPITVVDLRTGDIFYTTPSEDWDGENQREAYN